MGRTCISLLLYLNDSQHFSTGLPCFTAPAPRTKNTPFGKLPARKPLKDRHHARSTCASTRLHFSRPAFFKLLIIAVRSVVASCDKNGVALAQFGQESVGRFEVDGREGDHLPDRWISFAVVFCLVSWACCLRIQCGGFRACFDIASAPAGSKLPFPLTTFLCGRPGPRVFA